MTEPRRPSDAVLAAFGASDVALQSLRGGRGLAWRAGPIVLRPSEADGEVQWKADVLAVLEHTDSFRAACSDRGCRTRTRPARSRSR
ncbi:hypothetical protein M2317_002101 [Microbacterium sp. ZKA21]|uniref:hypothetical protein n=1 Tax=Microbacterium sp. ZKA21 TaxID=3381694 RepID=UPI003D214A7C